MRIINLHAENFKRLEAVDITPQDNLVVLSGQNGHGKSSVLDAIMSALAGGRGMKDIPEPIRRGEEQAEVGIDLGDLKIRRVWRLGEKPRIEVTNANGAKYSSPQGILDALTGTLTFDPLEFAQMQPREQRATLLRLVDLPFDIDENDRLRASLVSAETAARQDVRRLEQDAAMLPKVPGGIPDEEVPATDIVREMQRRMDAIQQNKDKRDECARLNVDMRHAATALDAARDLVLSKERELEAAKAQSSRCETAYGQAVTLAREATAAAARLVDPDNSELEEKLSELESINFTVRQKKANAKTRAALNAARENEALAKQDVAAHDKARAAALAAAKFPVDGLGFDDDGVTLNGLPFAQASESQRIMTSAAIGAAMNPRLKVLLIRDGNALDDERMNQLAEYAERSGYQIWVESIRPGQMPHVEIVDGRLAETEKNMA